MTQNTETAESTKSDFPTAAAWLRRHPGVFSKDTFYARLHDGTIPSLRIGKKILVPDDLLDRLFAEAGQKVD